MGRRGNAALTWTTAAGQDAVHLLGSPLRELEPRFRRTTFSHESADGTAINVVTIGDGVWELAALLRYDGLPEDLLKVLADGVAQQTLRYYRDLTRPGHAFDAQLVPAGSVLALARDADTWFRGEYQYALLLRRTDGGSFDVDSMGSVAGAPVVQRLRGGASLDRWTYSRAAVAGADRFIGRDGLLGEVTADDVARTEWMDLDGDGVRETPTTLLELARTNLVLRSEEFDNAVWAKASGLTVTADQATAPDGTTTADLIERDGAAGSQSVNQEIIASAAADRYAQRVALRAGTLDDASFAIRDQTAGAFPAQTIRIVRGPGTVTQGATPKVEGLSTSEWTVIEVVLDAAATATNTLRMWLYPGTTATVAGDLYAWGAVAVRGAFCGSYIKTVAATVTRSVDDLRRALPAPVGSPGSPWASYTRWVAGMAGDGDIGSPRIWQHGELSPARLTAFWLNDTELALLHNYDGSAEQAQVTAAVVAGDVVELLAIWNPSDTITLAVSVNGAAVVTDTTTVTAVAGEWDNGNTRYLNARNAGNNAGAMNLRDDVVAAGVPTGSAATIMAAFRRFVDHK